MIQWFCERSHRRAEAGNRPRGSGIRLCTLVEERFQLYRAQEPRDSVAPNQKRQPLSDSDSKDWRQDPGPMAEVPPSRTPRAVSESGVEPVGRFSAWTTPEGLPQFDGRTVIDRSRSGLAPSAREWTLFVLLFGATILSTMFRAGPAYAAWLLVILFCHEMGHYLTARHYRVRTSLPLFLPFPISAFGTFGAIILLRQRIRTRRILFDIGIAGPLAGIPAALGATVWGVGHSRVVDAAGFHSDASLQLGSSLLFGAVERFYFPNLGDGQDILLHPVAFAGWAGLFLTSLNLLPIGQLDGGHILYGLLGGRARVVSWFLAVAIAVAGYWFPGWWVLLAFLLFTRLRHPSTDDERVPLGQRRVVLGVFALVFFVLTFIPRPITLP